MAHIGCFICTTHKDSASICEWQRSGVRWRFIRTSWLTPQQPSGGFQSRISYIFSITDKRRITTVKYYFLGTTIRAPVTIHRDTWPCVENRTLHTFNVGFYEMNDVRMNDYIMVCENSLYIIINITLSANIRQHLNVRIYDRNRVIYSQYYSLRKSPITNIMKH